MIRTGKHAMHDRLSIEHSTFGLMGPLAHTPTQSMSIHCVIFCLGERVVLLDTGFGRREMSEPNRLLGEEALFKLGIVVDLRRTAYEQPKARGVDPGQVSDIVLTHMDNDHAGGLHDFPNAVVHVSSEELDGFDGLRQRGPYKPYQISHQTKFRTYGGGDETWFGPEARSLDLSPDLDAKLVPLPGQPLAIAGSRIWRMGNGRCMPATPISIPKSTSRPTTGPAARDRVPERCGGTPRQPAEAAGLEGAACRRGGDVLHARSAGVFRVGWTGR